MQNISFELENRDYLKLRSVSHIIKPTSFSIISKLLQIKYKYSKTIAQCYHNSPLSQSSHIGTSFFASVCNLKSN